MNRFVRRFLFGAVAVAAVLTMNVNSAAAESSTGARQAGVAAYPAKFLIRNLGPANLCLGIQGSSGAGGANAVLGSCAGSATQRWSIEHQKYIGGFLAVRFKNDLGNCLGVTGSSQDSGARVVQGACADEGDHSQFWRLDVPFPYSLWNGHSGMCMGVRGGNDIPGAQVVQGHCDPSSTQGWYPVAI